MSNTTIQLFGRGIDTIVVQATGSGKSLCFQLPSLFDRQKFVVVVTPTISLINSQIEELKKLNIDAIALGRSAGQDAQRNDDRLFYNNGTSPLPSLVFMSPEHFVNRVCYSLGENKESIKLLVLDEMHKMFDRNSNFRLCYDFFKGIKERFPCVPVMALIATLSKGQLQSLCVDYLQNPVLIKSLINRSNIKLNIKSYVHTKKSKSSADGKLKFEGRNLVCMCNRYKEHNW
ncbi:ATP-dependent DNA helicase, family [Paramuricea clavata]|uniref:ATP-dependent DNA helicase, family n=1 Tax=Paramuricea clavata TaxID=317549 RepID=A0A7D9K2M4_PARCT|nr:ATP-dependent DNA helicase, family [Paramuricea clavata]